MIQPPGRSGRPAAHPRDGVVMERNVGENLYMACPMTWTHAESIRVSIRYNTWIYMQNTCRASGMDITKKNIVGMRNLVCGLFHKHWWWKDHDLTKFVAILCLYNSRRLVPGSMSVSQAATQNSTERGGGIARCARASFVPPTMPLQHQVALPGVQIQSRRERHAEKRMKKACHIFRCQ